MHESIDLIDQNNSPNTAQTSEHSRNQVDVSKSICCAPLRDYINRTVQGPRLVLSTFLYISVLTIFVLTCYIIFQSFNYGFIKNREDMLVGTSQVVRINSFSLLNALSTPSLKKVDFSNTGRNHGLKAIIGKKIIFF